MIQGLTRREREITDIEEIIKILKKENIISSLLWKFLERCSVQLITFLVGIILARILMPSDYGAIAILLVFTNLASVIVETNTPPTIGDHVFSSNPVCTIPCGTKSAYEASDWAQYMGELVEYIPELTSGFCGETQFGEYADTKLSISGEGAMYDNIVEC